MAERERQKAEQDLTYRHEREKALELLRLREVLQKEQDAEVLQQLGREANGEQAGLLQRLTEELELDKSFFVHHLLEAHNWAEPEHLGPVRPPSGARNFSDFAEQLQRTPYPSEGPAVAEVYQTQLPQAVTSSLKMCLVCQSQVETGSEHDVGCSHVVHKKCISVWLQSTKNNSCPFCPSK
ncbi:hypothetical protein GJAV_G00128900 [Gymnothorax javanicus]|nr:hypothetical protein GJAV_G00128900 [Gymnothorax javanicus]